MIFLNLHTHCTKKYLTKKLCNLFKPYFRTFWTTSRITSVHKRKFRKSVIFCRLPFALFPCFIYFELFWTVGVRLKQHPGGYWLHSGIWMHQRRVFLPAIAHCTLFSCLKIREITQPFLPGLMDKHLARAFRSDYLWHVNS